MGLEPTAFCMASRFKACGAFPIRIEFPVNKPVAGSGGRARPVQPRLQLSASQCRHARRGGRPTPLFRLRAANSAPSPIRHPPCLPSSASADSARRTHTRGRCGRWPGARAARRPAAGFGGPLDQSPATHAPEGGRFRPGRNPPEQRFQHDCFQGRGSDPGVLDDLARCQGRSPVHRGAPVFDTVLNRLLALRLASSGEALARLGAARRQGFRRSTPLA
jgi:hypothetical protein